MTHHHHHHHHHLSLPQVLVVFLIVQLATVHLIFKQLDAAGSVIHRTNHVSSHSLPSAISNTSRIRSSSSSSIIAPLETRAIRLFNPWDWEKFVCGTLIAPNSTASITVGGQDCPEEQAYSRVFQKDPTIHSEDLPSIMIHFLDKKNKNQPHDVKDCDVPCSVWPTGNPTVRDPAKIDGTPFQFAAYSMEGSGIYKSLEVDPTAHQKYKYYATTSFQSEVPLSYYSPLIYNIQHPPVDFDTAIKGASFLARNCNSVSGREMLVHQLIQEAAASSTNADFRVESLSACMRNALPPKDVDLNNKTEVMSSYLFHLSFENQKTNDYITEKLWGALESGTVPIYFGAPNIREHVPPRSIIVVEDFSSIKELVSYLMQLSNNRALYHKYHEWRKKPLPQFFLDKYEYTKVHSYCRVCRFSFAMKYGYGWDHGKQQVRPLQLPRGETCLNEQDRMTSPLQESWILDGRTSDIYVPGRNDCGVSSKITTPIQGTLWTRTLWDHDLVTDVEITRQSTEDVGELVWQLKLPSNRTKVVRVKDPRHKEVKHDIFWIQDEISRVVVAFNESADWTENLTDSLQVRILNPVRVRFIVEDIDTFHQNGAETQSYFASFMVDDFLHPLQQII